MLELNSGMMQELAMRQNPAVKAAAGVTHYYIYDPDRYAWADNLLDRGCKWDEEYCHVAASRRLRGLKPDEPTYYELVNFFGSGDSEVIAHLEFKIEVA